MISAAPVHAGVKEKGGCCSDFGCQNDKTEIDCENRPGGIWLGKNINCTAGSCQGACCGSNSCKEVNKKKLCDDEWLGTQSDCQKCVFEAPSTSGHGLIVLAILIGAVISSLGLDIG